MQHLHLAMLAALGLVLTASTTVLAEPVPSAPLTEAVAKPNIVFILFDDYSSELVSYMDGLNGLAEDGFSFSSHIVSDPLCCPSRASILTGKYPHNTGVLSNQWPTGGMAAFQDGQNESSTIGVYLNDAGYRTGFMGKYLNGYKPQGGGGGQGAPVHPPRYVPPGWDEWLATGAAYQNFSYRLVEGIDGEVENLTVRGVDEENYLTDVLSDRAEDFIDRNAGAPFFLMINPFAVHGNAGSTPDPEGPGGPNFPPAPRDRADSDTRPVEWSKPEFPAGGDCGKPLTGGCDQLAYPDPSWGTSFNQPPRHAPSWYGPNPQPLPQDQLEGMRRSHLQRVQMSQSLDDMINEVRAALEQAGVLDETYLVVSSDNGYHLGQHALAKGKSTAYDSDVRTPLVILPPGGLEAPVVVPHVVQNVDFLPTFLNLAGETIPAAVDGLSFADTITRTRFESKRSVAFIEFNGESEGARAGRDPDREEGPGARPGKYSALRTLDYLYVDYSVLDRRPPGRRVAEFYNLTADPDMMDNIFRDLSRQEERVLNADLRRFASCVGVGCIDAALDVSE